MKDDEHLNQNVLLTSLPPPTHCQQHLHRARSALTGCLQRQPLWTTLSLGFAVAGAASMAPTSTADCAGATAERTTLPVRQDAAAFPGTLTRSCDGVCAM